MKLDKIRFATLLVFLCDIGAKFAPGEVERLDQLIDVESPVVTTGLASQEQVDELIKQMALKDKIPAIKAYRALTNAGLKEAKDAVERYWVTSYTPTKALTGAEVGAYDCPKC